MIMLGIDPGTTGALAVIERVGDHVIAAEVHDLPVKEARGGKRVKHSIDARALAVLVLDIRRRLDPLDLMEAVVEGVRYMPGANIGSSSLASMAHSRGVVEGVLGALRVPVGFVEPRAWKGHYGLKSDKGESQDRARALYPSLLDDLKRAKDHNRAEALLIAHWALNARLG